MEADRLQIFQMISRCVKFTKMFGLVDFSGNRWREGLSCLGTPRSSEAFAAHGRSGSVASARKTCWNRRKKQMPGLGVLDHFRSANGHQVDETLRKGLRDQPKAWNGGSMRKPWTHFGSWSTPGKSMLGFFTSLGVEEPRPQRLEELWNTPGMATKPKAGAMTRCYPFLENPRTGRSFCARFVSVWK